MNPKPFGAWRAFLWPVHRGEYSKFIPMFLISFLLCFNYYLLKISKDAILITAPESGAEALPFIKVWAILPAALLMTVLFTRFSNILNRRNVFYAMIGVFILYFTFFTFVLYPHQDQLHPHAFADTLQALLPQGFKGMIAIIRNWTFSTFYIMSEMWSTMIMTIVFWGFANDVTSVKDAKRFYGLFAVGTNLSGVVAGALAAFLSKHHFNPSIPFGTTAWDQSVCFMNLTVIAAALLSMGLYWWMNRSGYGYNPETLALHREAPIKMSMRKSIASITQSPYLLLVATLVVTCNIVINLTEVVWKDQVKQLYPFAADFNAYMASVNLWSALLAAVISFFITGYVTRSLGWTKSALIAPVLTLLTGVLFFTALLTSNKGALGASAMLASSNLGMIVFLGSLQNCIMRGTKSSLFDATKELAFVPLPGRQKLNGKAAIDGIGSRLGKSGGSLFHQLLLIAFGTIVGSTPIVAGVLLLAILGWLLSVRLLGRQFQTLTTDPATIS